MNLLTHLGLGDHLITYGLVRELAIQHDHINLFCKQQNYCSLVSLYFRTNIYPVVIKDEAEAFGIMAKEPYNSLKIGFTSEQETELEFGEAFYKQAQIPFEVRYKYEIPHHKLKIHNDHPAQPFKFIHDTDEFKIDLGGFSPMPGLTDNILDYCEVIEGADEIHVIESSFRQLIEFLNPKGKLFLHKFENKSFRVVPSRHTWEIIQH